MKFPLLSLFLFWEHTQLSKEPGESQYCFGIIFYSLSPESEIKRGGWCYVHTVNENYPRSTPPLFFQTILYLIRYHEQARDIIFFHVKEQYV